MSNSGSTKIVVHMAGGVIQNVLSNKSNIDFIAYDYEIEGQAEADLIDVEQEGQGMSISAYAVAHSVEINDKLGAIVNQVVGINPDESPNLTTYVFSGRVIGDLDDTVHFVEAENMDLGSEIFKAYLLKDMKEDDVADLVAEFGDPIIVNTDKTLQDMLHNKIDKEE
jgi:hypothetical protein